MIKDRLTKVLGSNNIRWVGGCVRDTLLEFDSYDIDCATTHSPNEVIKLCEEADIKVTPTGIDHGTVTAVLEDRLIEITTLRKDVETDGRRATVSFTKDWKEDAARRDFTINALYAHPETYEISDYFGGLDDLKKQKVRFIGSARQRIKEDYLRILRYFRFQARFGVEWDEEAVTACEELAKGLHKISRERITSELLNICSLKNPYDVFAKMYDLGVLRVILPESTDKNLNSLLLLIKSESDQKFEPDTIRRLASLVISDNSLINLNSLNLRLSKKQQISLIDSLKPHVQPIDPRILAYNYGKSSAINQLLLAGSDATILKGWSKPKFPLRGKDIIDSGIPPGPKITRIMKEVENIWVKENFPNDLRTKEILKYVIGIESEL